eukprot:scaffold56744_cov46-Attheya_sp.AAC.1
MRPPRGRVHVVPRNRRQHAMQPLMVPTITLSRDLQYMYTVAYWPVGYGTGSEHYANFDCVLALICA